ncbi:hypothetical protein [Actinoplanes sp. NPDC051494]|uniref:hypothetical protein n=1 Tax=Actinoplanes sp. NPDC051494 TaxID=3363907 RepID=UPI00378874D5
MRSKLTACALAVLAVTGCTSESGQTPPAATKAPIPTKPIDQEAMEQALADAGIPPKPDAVTSSKYLAALKRINPELVEDRDPASLIDRGRDQCNSIKSFPDDEAKWLWWTNQRFTSPEHPEGFGDATAAKILDVVRTHICPTY